MSDKIRVGLFGFGRIGRNVFRQLVDHPRIEVAAIADTADPEALVYLLRFDTIFGRFPKPVTLEDGALVLDGRRIPMSQDRDPGDTDWAAHGVDIVIQATRKHRTAAELQGHLDRGAKRVILASTPENPTEIDTMIVGVNDEVLDPSDLIISLGSNTSNALAPVLETLDETFGIERAMFTTIHAFTNEQRLADVPGAELRMSRAAAENIIPTSTNSPEIIERVLPQLVGKVSGMALNVPVPDGSNIDLVVELSKETTVEELNATIAEAGKGRLSNILEFVADPIVSSDVIGNPHSAIFDSLATMVMGGTLAKMVIWFDNGWGYAARAVEVIETLDRFDEEGA